MRSRRVWWDQRDHRRSWGGTGAIFSPPPSQANLPPILPIPPLINPYFFSSQQQQVRTKLAAGVPCELGSSGEGGGWSVVGVQGVRVLKIAQCQEDR